MFDAAKLELPHNSACPNFAVADVLEDPPGGEGGRRGREGCGIPTNLWSCLLSLLTDGHPEASSPEKSRFL